MPRRNNSNPKLSIISVYYGGLENLVNLIKSVRSQKTKYSYEIIVVNNKLDERIEKPLKKIFLGIKYIESPGNIGYGRGNNLGAEHARGEYLFIINPDTELKPGSIEALVGFLDKNKKAAIVAPNLIYQSGKLLENIGSRTLTPIRGIFALSFLNKLFPRNKFSREYYLKDVPKTKLREVGVVPGTAFVIRKSVFEKIGGFDKNFFLFFEEADLCKRIIESGYKVYITPKAVAVHDWTPAERPKLKKFYEQSRFYYFKKHFGIFPALIVEVFTRVSRLRAALVTVFIIAAFLRFWQMEKFLNYGNDIGWYFLQARDFALSGKIPLVSIPTSVPVFRQGAIWTWILIPVLKLGGFNPVSAGFLAGVFGLASIMGSFYLASSWFGKRVGIILALFASTSLYLVLSDRMPFQITPIFFTTILFAYYLRGSVILKKDNCFFT